MKRCLLVFTGLLALAISGVSHAADFEKALRPLVAQTYYSPNMSLGFDTFIKNVSNRLPHLSIRLFHGNEIVSSPQLMDGVRSGLVSIGQIITHMYAQIPAGKLFAAMPFVTDSAEEADILFDSYGYRQFIAKELAKKDLVYLGPTWSAPYHLVTKKPVRTLDELKGMRIRALGSIADIFTKLGVTCVNIAPENLSMALNAGDIDGVIFGSAYDYKQAGLYEVARWYNITPLAVPVVDSLVVSRKVWDELTVSERAVFQEEADKVRWLWYKNVQQQEPVLRKSLFKNYLCSFSDTDKEQLKIAATSVLNEEILRYPAAKEGVDILIKFMSERH